MTHVFHLAAQAGVRKSWGADFRIYTDNNVDATQKLLEACAGRPLHRFVYASSSSVYGDNVSIPMREDALPQPVSPYGVTKLSAEQLCYLYFVNHRVPATSVRYFTVYGPRQRPDMAFHRFIRAALHGEPISLYGDGEQTRDFTYVLDAVAATVAAGDRGVPGRVYNIGGGSVSMNQVLEIIGASPGAGSASVRKEHRRSMRDTRRYDPGARRPRIYAHGFARGRHCRGVSLAGGKPGARIMTRLLRACGGWLLLVVLTSAIAGCGSDSKKPPVGTLEPDKFLFERGTDNLTKKRWFTAREYFRQIVDSYPQSPYRPDAKLGIGDTYLGENSAESNVLAINEYREFLSFYPTHDRAYYAQYQLGMCHFKQMHGPDRDQSETKDAIAELTIMTLYASLPKTPRRHAPRQAAPARSEGSLAVPSGTGYSLPDEVAPGAIDRFKSILKSDPSSPTATRVLYLAQSLGQGPAAGRGAHLPRRLLKSSSTANTWKKRASWPNP